MKICAYQKKIQETEPFKVIKVDEKRIGKAARKISDIFDMLDIDDQIFLVCMYSRVAFRDMCSGEAYQLLAEASSKPRLYESMATRTPAPSSLRFKFTVENLGGQR